MALPPTAPAYVWPDGGCRPVMYYVMSCVKLECSGQARGAHGIACGQ